MREDYYLLKDIILSYDSFKLNRIELDDAYFNIQFYAGVQDV